MRYLKYFFVLFFCLNSVYAQNTISTSGNNFIPDSISIFLGDSINFVLGNNHNAIEVDSLTYFNNGNSPLSGGFNIGFGQDSTILLDSIKTHYYVCQTHVNFGMKGMIMVLSPPIYGCTDTNACNYDLNADIDDGSCNYNDSTYINSTICDSFTWDGTVYDSSGVYSNTYINLNGCDSIVFLNLTILYSYSLSLFETSCDLFVWYNNTYFTSGAYDTVFTSLNGCDSTITLNLTINNSSIDTIDITTCDYYNWNGIVYDSSGVYNYLFLDENGCDSLVSINLTINLSSTSLVSITSCDNFTWDGVTYDSTGIYSNTYSDLNGCDSLVILDLIVNYSPQLSLTQNNVTCFSANDGSIDLSFTGNILSFLWSNNESSEDINSLYAGDYSVLVTDSNNCFSSLTTTITQPQIIDTNIFISICSWDSFSIGNSTYNSSGDFLSTITASNGCDSLVYLNLNVFDTLNAGNIIDDQFLCFGSTPLLHSFDILPSGVDSIFSLIWESSTDGVNWLQSNNSSLNFQPPSLNQSTYYRVVVSSDFGCGSDTTNFVLDSIFDPLSPATINSNQDICYDTSPNSLNVSQVSTGGGLLSDSSYIWQSSLNGLSNWQDIGYGLSYSPGSLTVDHFFRVKTVSNFNCGPVFSNLILINVYDPLSSGAINSSQNICFNTEPDSLSFAVLPTGSDGDYTFVWQYSLDDQLWVDIPSSDNLIYQPPVLDTTHFYRSIVISDFGCGTVNTSSLMINVYDEFITGSIDVTDTICYNTDGEFITTINMPSGGHTPYSYVWSFSLDSTNWNIISNTNSPTYDPPLLIDTTYYRVNYISNAGCGELLSNTSQIIVLPLVDPGYIENDQFLCFDSLASPLYMSLAASGGDNNYSYQWQSSIDNVFWIELIDSISTTYSPGFMNQSTFFRLKTRSTYSSSCIDRFTNSVDIQVFDPLASGIINSSQDICFNTEPDSLSFAVLPTGSDGDYTFGWQYSLDDQLWVDIPNSDSLIYQPPVLDTTHFYRSIVISDFGCGTVNTSSLMINVYDEFITGSINVTDTICYNTDGEFITTINMPSGGHTPYTYEWYFSLDSTNWNVISTPNIPFYDPQLLIDTTYYRVNYISNAGCGELLSNTSQIIVLPLVDPGYIENDQFLCFDSLASPLYMSFAASGGDNNYVYKWQFSNDNNSWFNIANSNTTIYSPGFMNQSTFFRMKTRSTYSSSCINRYTNSVDVHVFNPLASGVINSSQDICYNTQPDSLSFSILPSGADSIYTYVWQYSFDDQIWLDILSSDSLIYQPNTLDSSKYYRVIVISDFGCGSVNTSSIAINVNDQFNSGLILQNDTICFLQNPELFEFINFPTGGNFNNSNLYNYQWQSNDDGIWNNINSANNNNYQALDLSDSTYFRVEVTSDCKVDLSNEIFVVVNPLPDTTAISGQMLVCRDQKDVIYSVVSPSSKYRYQWECIDANIIGTNESQNLSLNWNTSNNSADLSLYVRDYQTSCEIYLDTVVNISENISPAKCQIILKPNTSILISNDSSLNIFYQWGLTNINSNIESIFIQDTLRYNQYNQPIDTIINRYWVDTYYNYSDEISCVTRSFFNLPPVPLNINNIDISDNFIYPNPTSGKLSINRDFTTLKVFDLYGKPLKISILFGNEIDLSSFKKGVYFIVAETESEIFFNKIILQ